MEFDHFTVTLLVRPPDAPELDDDAASAVQDAHLAYLAELHEAGHLLAAGPLPGAADRRLRGMCILRVDAERARELSERDPAVRAGVFAVEVLPGMVPSGAIAFSPTRFPRSSAEATR